MVTLSSATVDPRSIEEHLAAMVAGLPSGVGFVLTKRRSGGGHVVRAWDSLVTSSTIDEAVRVIEELAPSHDVWISTTATDQETFENVKRSGPGKRGGRDDARRLVALFADVDCASGEHSKANLPPDVESARSILEGMPKPSLLIHSGGGLHAWWLIDEPVEIGASRTQCEDVLNRFVRTLGAKAALLGWTFDESVGELARILRVAGTLNHKTEPPRPVAIEDVAIDNVGQIPRYGFDELATLATWTPAPALPTKASIQASQAPSPAGTGILDACKAAAWSEIWPPDWRFVGCESVDGVEVERWLRPGASSDVSVKCWPEGGCQVWSEAIEGLSPAGNSKADVLAWRLGLTRSELAREIISEARRAR